MQPEIIYVLKLCRIRKQADKIKANKKFNVMRYVNFLHDHVSANGYNSERLAKSFFARHCEKIYYIIPGGKEKLKVEFKELLNGCISYK